MKRREIINCLRKKLKKYHITKFEIDKTLRAFEKLTIEALQQDEEIWLRGFLRIYPLGTRAREGYNPMTENIEKFLPRKKAKAKLSSAVLKKLNRVGSAADEVQR